MHRLLALLVLAAAILAGCQTQAADPPAPAKSTIKFPTLPAAPPKEDVKPEPIPPKPDEGKIVLKVGVYYVIQDDAPFLTYASPPDRVKITKVANDAGTAKLLGVFIDGTGEFEERSYKAKHLTIIRAIGTGPVELIVNAANATSESTAERKTIDVDAGQGPIPPPKPIDDKKVDPKPATTFRVIFVHESGKTLPLGLQPVMDAKAVRDYLEANTTKNGTSKGWRRYDQNDEAEKDDPVMAALWSAVQPKLTDVPCLVVEVDGKAVILPYPKNAQDSLNVLKKYREGK